MLRNDSPKLYIDAGISQVRAALYVHGSPVREWDLAATGELPGQVRDSGLRAASQDSAVRITGKLAEPVRRLLGRGTLILPAAALWAALRERQQRDYPGQRVGLLEISASGYLALALDCHGGAGDTGLVIHPRCGAGSGTNLTRVLQKLDVPPEAVDTLLAEYLGETGRERRSALPVRADRCGVFGASATISDKNQGIPVAHALAVTLKSEINKACRRLPLPVDRVLLCGGLFRWAFARDCAVDALTAVGVPHVTHMADANLTLEGLRALDATAPDPTTAPSPPAAAAPAFDHPAFTALESQLEERDQLHRLPAPALDPDDWRPGHPVNIGLDVGSTMAKMVIADAEDGRLLHAASQSNAGETIATLKALFTALQDAGHRHLNVGRIGITGSARYQVREALTRLYPALEGRVAVMVENYAHARGSLAVAREHVGALAEAGHDVDTRWCILVDIGGEDTKISTLLLERGDLFDNAMNIKCSAGTGSLMDTLASLFGLPSAREAYEQAQAAPGAHDLDATCSVFLMEHARTLQARGVGNDVILASACWAVVENMARTLWNQISLPPRTVVLLHGQPMLGRPLPAAVVSRLQRLVGAPIHGLVPPLPGHRACLGLLPGPAETQDTVSVHLNTFIQREYDKRIITCKGAVCGDPQARCHRTALKSIDPMQGTLRLTLGGCSAINEATGRKGVRASPRVADPYQALWRQSDQHLPRSEAPDRLVIPRAFAVSEWAGFFAELFTQLDLPVHVDNPQTDDVLAGQSRFRVDTCAPHLGAVGQLTRLAGEPHGYILAPQIEFLPLTGAGLGRSCTVNQGGLATARAMAQETHPKARIQLFHLNLRHPDAAALAAQLWPQLRSVFAHYHRKVDRTRLESAIDQALAAQRAWRQALQDTLAAQLEEAMADGQEIALVLGREYILTPGLYDSHAGRLLRDRALVPVPAHVLDVTADDDLAHLYWRNPQVMTTLVRAVSRRRLHTRLRHERLRRLFQQLEAPDRQPLALVFVSTFLCGPDSVTLPLMAEFARQRPFLLIQSDAAIQELAHLENRVNTHAQQVRQYLSQGVWQAPEEGFEVQTLQRLTDLSDGIDPERDVLALPTLADNRFVTSVLQSTPLTCLDNYDDTYDLEAAIRRGRAAAGESVCAPLAAVYGDTLSLVERFRRLRQDPQSPLYGKRRLLVFNNKGLGPCRQGQYVETHKLLFHRNPGDIRDEADEGEAEDLLRFLVAMEDRGFDVGLGKAVLLRCMQGAVLQGVCHQLLFEAAARCPDTDALARLRHDHRALTEAIFQRQREFTAPERALSWWPAWTRHRRALQRPLRDFAGRWLDRPPVAASPLKIHVEGETYMRVAQVEALFDCLLRLLGPGRFRLTYTPVWSYLDYKNASRRWRSLETVRESHARLSRTTDPDTRLSLRRLRNARTGRYLGALAVEWGFRQWLARPLYRAAGLPLPESMAQALTRSRRLIPTGRPGGELSPYVGEALGKLEAGYDIVFNVAPEGCMVSSMGDAMSGRLTEEAGGRGRIQPLFSAQGTLDEDLVSQALLQAVGPEGLYRRWG
ncbi:acyl-CoA dehydratase activase-related protein [Ectothiorhodospira lacustris]|uniref:acyl-CoA dehydratase activase-related protein n=1 Tax=Ectothiorhodospira lacustris TaxID=2899127 RepID=UPI001EE884A1|nr:acyl-CoA dehydratase activase-related protein [Ectothiorhodospira lacustris]MCG5509496.1 acyl-CoA dehydratase activase-related protein [Ectothiorhodospira lacustris]MCG5521709.1 acyl-CoA dehydratase activase-related protein [Ectothiorhodospira lacustris]